MSHQLAETTFAKLIHLCLSTTSGWSSLNHLHPQNLNLSDVALMVGTSESLMVLRYAGWGSTSRPHLIESSVVWQ